jgi:hypothetical protein
MAQVRALAHRLRPLKTDHPLIRLGGAGDGGYLVPDDFNGLAACFSPGVSEIADFELALANRGIPCFLADYSVDAPPVPHPLFHFEKKFLGSEDNEIFTTMASWVERHAPGSGDLLLQMDIEGSEYAVIHAMPEALLQRFRLMVIEFHDADQIFSKAGCELLRLTFEKLASHFDVVHIHPNNCGKIIERDGFSVPRLLEITFLRKDRVTTRSPATTFPHPLDKANVSTRPDIALPSCWWAT